MEQKEWDRLAENYHEEVISPFYGDVENPLFDELKKIKNRKNKLVAEFGCGLFYLGETLSKQFKEVYAFDFSPAMVKRAKEKNKSCKNTKIGVKDIRKMRYNNKFDIIISVNSIIMPSYNDIDKSFRNIHNALKKKGIVLMILPSMESVIYNGSLILHKQLEKFNESTAKRTAKVKFENKKYDFFNGYYTDGSERQKFYYKHEVLLFLKKAGFKDIEISKVKYPWGKNISDYEDFPCEEKLWDWFVKARK
ncbi:class I SAM-dependent methyltransferase [Candidatus Woesearchaeota archaeon]|nr:class I SAM-dependent methyltransferase [Candidatus Woesearchaeota archaeon]